MEKEVYTAFGYGMQDEPNVIFWCRKQCPKKGGV